MAKPRFTDYVELIHTLFDQFTQAQRIKPKRGRPYDFKDKILSDLLPVDANAPHHRI